MSLNGGGAELVKDDTTGVWRPKNDDGSKIELLTGATNGDNNGEHWRVTTADGTQYYFGLARLPKWVSGKSETKSTWTAPIFGDDAGEPCHGATFAASSCNQAWRWNLDYVVDPRGNAMSMWYGTETNYYAKNKVASPGTPYIRGGYLSQIDYGQRSDTIFSVKAPYQVVFDVRERCIPTASFDCAEAKFTSANKSHWPDVPFDQHCASGAACTNKLSPTFWTRKRLAGIKTQHLSGTAYTLVDNWIFDQSIPPAGDVSDPSLRLDALTHTGNVGGTATLPKVSFGYKQMDNRVDGIGDGLPAFLKWRIIRVDNEHGGTTTVSYSGKECAGSALPAPATNTKRCFPQRIPKPGATDPNALITDWLHKYRVEQVSLDDRVGGTPASVTNYQYVDQPAWHYADDQALVSAKFKTWSQWRGYSKVRVRVRSGAANETQSRTDYVYFRGMHGDRANADGSQTKTVKITDSQGDESTDLRYLQGTVREQITYNGANGAEVSGQINTPWTHGPTAKHGSLEAWSTETGKVRNRVALAAGGERVTEVVKTFNADGTVQQEWDRGVIGDVGKDDLCTNTTYVSNAAKAITGLVSRKSTVSLPCDQTPTIPDDAVSDVQTSYDLAYGEPTEVKEASTYSGATPQYVTTAKTVYDGYGRITQTSDAAGNKTTTGYTPATGGPVTAKTVTNALGHAATQTLNPAWGVPTQTKDANSNVTTMAYDPLGRLVKAWGPTRTTSQTPNAEFAYLITGSAPTAVTTKQLMPNGQQKATFQIYDGWLRPRQSQAPGTSGGRVLTDVYYDTRGQGYKSNQAYFDNRGGPGTTLLAPAQDNAVPNQIVSTIDGAGRTTNSAYYKFATKQWETATSYGGDRVTVTPPKGATPTTTLVNARGKTTELWQYKSGTASGDHDTTTYAYTPAGELTTVTDPAGNQWKYSYDFQGRPTKTDDPDRGVTTLQYNSTGGVAKTTDAENRALAFTYDALGRRTGQYKDSTTGPKLAEWTYDTVPGAKGAAAASTRWVNGQAYKQEITSYDKAYRPLTSQVTIPTTEGNLGKTYPTTVSYMGDGSVSSMSLPQAGVLPAETMRYIYDNLGRLTAQTGTENYVQGTTYTDFGEVSQLTLGTATSKWVWQTNYYEEGTRRLARSRVDRETIGVRDDDVNYTYDPSGNITKVANTPAQQTADVQCFGHDHLRRLTQAWTAASADDTCETTPTPPTAGSAIGGPQPYWQSFGYDTTGSRTKDVQHDVTGDTAKDRTSTYTYDGNGQSQPHTLTKLQTTSDAGTSLNTYAYDKTGNTTLRQVGGDDQNLERDVEGRLSKVSKTTEQGTQSSSYLYDANGNLLIRTDSDNSKTLFLDGQELKMSVAGTVTGTRYYEHGGQVIAVRTENGTGTKLSWLISDHLGTAQVAIDAKTQELTRRRYLPFGQLRTAPANWPGTKTFVGGTPDPTTGMVHLGAREYDADTGRFASVDAITDHANPQQLNGYAYANNSPVSGSDASGLFCRPAGDGKVDCYNGDGVDRRPNSDGGYTVYKGNRPVYYTGNSGSGFSTAQIRRQMLEAKAAEMRARVAAAQARIANAAKVIAKIAADELGITAGIDCLTTGDLGACGETVLNLLGNAVGGFAAKILAKYANPFKWGKAANLAKQLWGAIKTIGGGIVDWFKARRELKVAEQAVETMGETCPTNSFIPGTRVRTGKNKYKTIEKIKPGDWVISTDPKTGKAVRKRVTAVIIGKGSKHLVRITIAADGAKGSKAESVVATEGHPFWATVSSQAPWRTKSISGWIDAGDLKPGMMLRTSDGRHVKVATVQAWNQQQRVHNLTVAGTHTYYVEAGDTPVLVHNCGGAVQGHPTRCNCAAGDTPKVRNGKLAGQDHPVTDVPFDEHGFPDFSVARHPDVPDVRIELSGNRTTDFARANRAAGLDETPDGYTWHHHQDKGLMQLIDEWTHANTGHTGGFSG